MFVGQREVYKVEVYARLRRAVQVDGMSIRQAAREFGLSRKTIRKMLRSPFIVRKGIRFPRASSSAPTAAIRPRARPPASTSTAEISSNQP